MEKDIFQEVQQRTQLAFTNQMEMLLFYLNDDQIYGINVFKIIEVIECPSNVVKMPYSHQSVKGTIDFRGKAVIVIDIGEFLGMQRQDFKNSLSYVIVCEYNNNIQGLIIKNPDSLVTRSWEEVKSPSSVLGKSGYLTAIAYSDNNEMIQILDIEKILVEILGMDTKIADEFINQANEAALCGHHILVIDDSKAARALIEAVLEQLGFTYESYNSASDALAELEADSKAKHRFCMSICDIEMPGIDGFTFTRKIRSNPDLKDLFILLHSSMSNPTNMDKAKQVGADSFAAKFQPDSLAAEILSAIKQVESRGGVGLSKS
ncbi:MAG: chemotaxis protein [Candidatus Magnetobacterium sp. LHC-1]|nr:chemotaxis protein CheV [Nitrospirota bacterium]